MTGLLPSKYDASWAGDDNYLLAGRRSAGCSPVLSVMEAAPPAAHSPASSPTAPPPWVESSSPHPVLHSTQCPGFHSSPSSPVTPVNWCMTTAVLFWQVHPVCHGHLYSTARWVQIYIFLEILLLIEKHYMTSFFWANKAGYNHKIKCGII